MRWDVVVEAWLGLIAPDSDVTEVLGADPEFFMAGEREFAAPGLEWSLIANTEGELWEISDVQLDFMVRKIDQLVKLEKALRRLLHHDLPITVDGIFMWSQMRGGGRPLQGPADGLLGRSIDCRLTYLRSRYT